MSKNALTGSRIRERRVIAGLRQSEMAASIGISASYLNLIEHNRRRIGGKLLLNIAAFLEVEPALLTEGAEAALIATLRDAADRGASNAEAARVDDFAGRFPGWAELLASQHRRIETLEHVVESLTDRLAHDPQLAASLHEVISMVTAIRSTAAILVETDELEPEWRDRFNRNINEDSARLAESSLGLVTYLDKAQDTESTLKLPMDEFEAFLTEHGFHFPGLETGEVGVQDLITKSALLQSGASRAMAQSWLEQYKRDAQLIPLDAIEKVLTDGKVEPAMIARQLNVDLATAIRRIATLPTTMLSTQVGLVACDASGTLVMRKPVAGFSLPRTGAACSMWPLYRALNRPAVPLSQVIEQAGPNAARFIGYAIAQPVGAISFEDAPIFEAHMLIVPTSDTTGEAALVVGSSCRICPKQECIGRREKSIMLDGF